MSKGNKRSVVFLTTIDNTADKSLMDFIERNFGTNTKINFLRSPKVYSNANGLADKIKNYDGIGTVIAIQDNFDSEKLEIAAKTGIRFAIVFKNESGEWEGFYIGSRDKKSPSANRTKKAEREAVVA
jgi:hypothetical protein